MECVSNNALIETLQEHTPVYSLPLRTNHLWNYDQAHWAQSVTEH